MGATNGTNGTSTNGSTASILSNAPQLQQQSQTPLQLPPPVQQQPLQQPPVMQQPLQQSPVMQQPLQQPIYCYYPNYNPQCVSGPSTLVSIVPDAATKLNQAFQPGLVYVNVGSRVTWANYDTQIHTVTSGSVGSASSGDIFNSGILSTGGTFSVTFVQPGIFSYQCTLHPQMVGTVVVS